MKRHTRPNHKSPVAPARRNRRQRIPARAVFAALALTGVVLLAIWLIPTQKTVVRSVQSADGSTWTVGMLRPDGLRIIVSGRDDASEVLDAERFSRAEVRQGYRIATQIPAVLNKLYCWCGCENRGVHRSNLQCFEDKMAQDCQVCLGTAEIAHDMTQAGITDAARIQAAVDVRWAPKQ